MYNHYLIISVKHPSISIINCSKNFSSEYFNTILKSLLSERIPISDLRKILEKLSTINNKNLSPYELAEIVGQL